MSDPIPIRKDINPDTDTGRELLEFCLTSIQDFEREAKCKPTTIALVLSGDDGGPSRHIVAYSWDQSEKRTQFETCSTASAILLKRAIL